MAKTVKYFRNVPQPADFDPEKEWLTNEEVKKLAIHQTEEFEKWAPDRRNLVFLEQTEYDKAHGIRRKVFLSDEDFYNYINPIEAEEKERAREKRCLIPSKQGLRRCEGKDCASCKFFIKWKNQSVKADSSVLYRQCEEDSEFPEFAYPADTPSPLDKLLEEGTIKLAKEFLAELSEDDRRMLEIYRTKRRKGVNEELGIPVRTINRKIAELKQKLLKKLK